MLDDQQFRIRLAGLGLCAHERQEGFGDDDVGFNAAFFEFDTVMETPRRARPSIGKSDDRPLVARSNLIVEFFRCRLRRAVLKEIIDVVR